MKNKAKKPNLNNNEEKLKIDEEILLEVAKNLHYVSNKIKVDEEVARAAVKIYNNEHNNELKNEPKELKHDKEIVLEAVKNFPFAPDKLKNDKDIVLAAVMQNPSIKMTDTVLNLTQQNNLKKEDLFEKRLKRKKKTVFNHCKKSILNDMLFFNSFNELNKCFL